MTNRSAIDLSTMDFSSLTPDQWGALKRHIIREAQRERAELIAGAFAALFGWVRNGIAKIWREMFVNEHPVFPTRRV